MSNTLTASEVSEVRVGVEATSLAAPMPKTRVAKRSRTRRPSTSGKTSRSKKQRNATAGVTKQALVLQMLRRQSGVSIDDIASKMGWQSHSVRGFLSGIVRKKLKLQLVSEVGKNGVRHYRVTSPKVAKA
jgi:ribosome-binding protein aMBF1 (putative translation factor)